MQRNCGLIRDEARGVGDFSSSSAKFCLSAFFLARRGIDFLERRARFFFFLFLLLTRKSERRERRESDGRLKNRGNKVEKKVMVNYLVTYTDLYRRLDNGHLLSRLSLSFPIVVPLLISLLLTDK